MRVLRHSVLLTNNKKVVGVRINSRSTNVLGWVATALTFLCTAALVVSWIDW